MAVRSLWIVSLLKDEYGEIQLFRTFPTVEKRCKIIQDKEYVPLPLPSSFVNNLLIKLGLSVSSKEFVEWRDKVDVKVQLPVVNVKIGDREIWPVLSIIQQSLLVCCLPLVETNDVKIGDNLLKIPSVSVGFSVLLGILNFCGMKFNEDKTSKLIELDNFLTLSMPFGVPSDTEPLCMMFLNSLNSLNLSKKQPAWKPVDYKGKQQISFKISEYVRCMQSEHTKDLYYEVFGQISVKADLEGNPNDVTVSIVSSDTSQPIILDSILVHPCVQMHGATSSASVFNLLKRLRFSPPLHEFILLQYNAPESKEPPIQGVFKMLGENSVELLIQLKLSEKIKNSFEFCDVIIVFFNRGPVKTFEFNTNYGTPKITHDKHSLKWNIGTKFPKDLEVAITAKLSFLETPVLPHSDPFCIEKNCYAQINFKQNNSTISGCNIDQKSVVVSQSKKPKISVERFVKSIEYRLWNNYGDVPFPVNISEKFEKLLAPL